MFGVIRVLQIVSCVPSLFFLSIAYPLVTFAADDGGCVLPNKGVVSGNVKLNSACTYLQGVRITDSNTYLDCDGATLDGEGKRAVGIQIDGKKKLIENVTVKNCRILNFKNRGINVTSGIPISDFSTDIDENYKLAPNKIMIDGVAVSGIGRGGVYFDSYATDSVLSNSTVENSGKVGVYLEQGTQRIKIINNTIRNNGLNGRREGLAVDSSAHNTIKGNHFIGNAGGGIFLYKNCGEHFSSGKSALRWQSSDFNAVQNNVFVDEPVGVWIASRQSRDLSKWGCGDPSVDGSGRFYADHANNNIVEGNDFCNTVTAVRVEGDNNTIAQNRIDDASRSQVIEPYQSEKKPDGQMTKGNLVRDNALYKCSR
jgi:parallel beta-helix repeat protein